MASFLHNVLHIGPDPAIVARIDALRAALAVIKVDIDTRHFLWDLTYTGGHHCALCSPLGKVGACGPTCALLRPTGSVLPGIEAAMSEKWTRTTGQLSIRYDKLMLSVPPSGYKVSISNLQQWEEAVELLQQRLA